MCWNNSLFKTPLRNTKMVLNHYIWSHYWSYCARSTFHYRTGTDWNQAGLTSSKPSMILKSTKISIVSINIYLHKTCRKLCLVLVQVAKKFVPVQIFWVSPKIWLCLAPLQKLLCRHKKQFLLNANHLFVWHKIFLTGTLHK